ncbi:UNVERIFIED_CONTAM: helicase, partial [Prevotella sp. 15_C9]
SEMALFHAHAYRLAVNCYQPLLPYSITLKEPSLNQSCRMTLDEQPYYNPAATTFCLEQPFAIPGETTFKEQKQAETNPL